MAFHISDTHFNHANIIQYCNRPFETVGEMENYIIKKWNYAVQKGDVVYHLGDFALGLSQEQSYDLVKRLNGKIILIMGNHDRKSKGWFEGVGFKEVYKKGFIWNDRYLLSHAPRDISQIPEGIINIHGHIHNHTSEFINKINQQEIRYINVSCEVLDYTPVWIE